MSDEIDWQTYVGEAVKTADPEQTPLERLGQAGRGMIGELSEVVAAIDNPLFDADGLADEVSDCFWYVAIADDALQRMGADPLDVEGAIETANFEDCKGQQLVHFCFMMSAPIEEALESAINQGEDIDPSLIGEYVEHYVAPLAEVADRPVREVWQHNVDKLRDRHGDSFTPADEQQR